MDAISLFGIRAAQSVVGWVKILADTFAKLYLSYICMHINAIAN